MDDEIRRLRAEARPSGATTVRFGGAPGARGAQPAVVRPPVARPGAPAATPRPTPSAASTPQQNLLAEFLAFKTGARLEDIEARLQAGEGMRAIATEYGLDPVGIIPRVPHLAARPLTGGPRCRPRSSR